MTYLLSVLALLCCACGGVSNARLQEMRIEACADNRRGLDAKLRCEEEIVQGVYR